MPSTSPQAIRPRKQPRQQRSRATVAAILEAAAQVFVEFGYAAGTTNRIAVRAGVSIGSLYEYFPNKDALLVALMEAHIAEGREVLAAAANEVLRPDMPLVAVADGLVRAMIDLHARDRALHRVLFEETPVPASVRRQLEAVEHEVATTLAAFMRDHPQVRVADPELAAHVLVQAVEALTHRLVVSGRPADLEAQRREFVRLIVGYLTCGGVASVPPAGR